MTQRYVAPIQIVSVQPEYPRYSVQEDRRKPVVTPGSNRRPDPQQDDEPSHRDFRALALLVLAVLLAVFVVISLLV